MASLDLSGPFGHGEVPGKAHALLAEKRQG